MSRRIHARHLGRLAAHQRAARQAAALGDAGDHRFRDTAFKLAGGKIVEEKQRLGALRQHVIGAHGHQVDADRVVDTRLESQHQLGADPVGAGHQHRIGVAGRLQVKQRAKPSQAAHHAGARGRLGHRRDGINQPLACLNIDTRIAV